MLNKVLRVVAKITSFRFSDSDKMQQLKIKFTNFKQKAKEDLYKFSFYALLVSSIFLFILNVGYFFLERSKNTSAGIESGQIALVDLSSDAIIVGNVVQDKLEKDNKQKAVAEIKERFDPEKIKEKKEKDEKGSKIFKAEVKPEDLKKSKVALVVRDLGLSKSLTLNTLDMKNNLTLGFTPYSVDVKNWVDQAVNKGFEVLVNIPMQPTDYPVNDPGPYAMINNLSKGENVSRFNWIATRSDKIAGYYTNEDETFSNSRSNFIPILERIKEGDRYLVFGNSSNSDGAVNMSEGLSVNISPVGNVIDTVLEEEKIRNKLLLLEAEAMRKGHAVGFLNPYPISLRVVQKWMKEIDNNKLVVVPVSAIFKSLEKKEEMKVKPMIDDNVRDVLTETKDSKVEAEDNVDIEN